MLVSGLHSSLLARLALQTVPHGLGSSPRENRLAKGNKMKDELGIELKSQGRTRN